MARIKGHWLQKSGHRLAEPVSTSKFQILSDRLEILKMFNKRYTENTPL